MGLQILSVVYFNKQATIQQINDAMNKKAWDDLQKQKALEAKKKLEAAAAANNTGGDGSGSWGGHGSVEAYDKSQASHL